MNSIATPCRSQYCFAIALAVGSFAMTGCGSARRDAPLREPLRSDNPQVARGQLVFMDKCYQCHPNGGSGLGPALNNKPLPEVLIRTQVRKGFGPMPAFAEDEISKSDLEALTKYTIALRRTGE